MGGEEDGGENCEVVGEFLNMSRSVDGILKVDDRGLKMELAVEKLNVAVVVLNRSEEKRCGMLLSVAGAAEYFAGRDGLPVGFCQIEADVMDVPGVEIDEDGGPAVVVWPAGAERKPLILPGSVGPRELIEEIGGARQ